MLWPQTTHTDNIANQNHRFSTLDPWCITVQSAWKIRLGFHRRVVDLWRFTALSGTTKSDHAIQLITKNKLWILNWLKRWINRPQSNEWWEKTSRVNIRSAFADRFHPVSQIRVKSQTPRESLSHDKRPWPSKRAANSSWSCLLRSSEKLIAW